MPSTPPPRVAVAFYSRGFANMAVGRRRRRRARSYIGIGEFLCVFFFLLMYHVLRCNCYIIFHHTFKTRRSALEGSSTDNNVIRTLVKIWVETITVYALFSASWISTSDETWTSSVFNDMVFILIDNLSWESISFDRLHLWSKNSYSPSVG